MPDKVAMIVLLHDGKHAQSACIAVVEDTSYSFPDDREAQTACGVIVQGMNKGWKHANVDMRELDVCPRCAEANVGEFLNGVKYGH